MAGWLLESSLIISVVWNNPYALAVSAVVIAFSLLWIAGYWPAVKATKVLEVTHVCLLHCDLVSRLMIRMYVAAWIGCLHKHSCSLCGLHSHVLYFLHSHSVVVVPK